MNFKGNIQYILFTTSILFLYTYDLIAYKTDIILLGGGIYVPLLLQSSYAAFQSEIRSVDDLLSRDISEVQEYYDLLCSTHADASHLEVVERSCDQCEAVFRQISPINGKGMSA